MKRKIIALILTTVMLAGILPVSAIADKDVWIDNTVDESQTQVKVTLEVEDPNTGNYMKYSIMDRMVPSSYSNGITADVSAAITEGVNAAMKMIEDKGFEFVDRTDTTVDDEKDWDNRKYETVEETTHIASGGYGRNHYCTTVIRATGSEPIYGINRDIVGNGNVKITPGAASAGTQITVTAQALPGYALADAGVFGPNGQISAGTYGNSGETSDTILFTMPAGEAEVYVSFKRMPAVKAAENVFSGEKLVRSAGDLRYDTAIATASYLKKAYNTDRFETIIVASGSGRGATGKFPDALAGSYLAARFSAPILMVGADGAGLDKTAEFIKENLWEENGVVYILGGPSAVPETLEQALPGIYTERIAGADRYLTNLSILERAGMTDGTDLLVADGRNFADALSASALRLPILLINSKTGKLTFDQEEFVMAGNFSNIYVLGGASAVPESVVDAIKGLKAGVNIERIMGADRYETSVAVARKFFPEANCISIATGKNFPDGLTGGPLAYALGAPLVLTSEKPAQYAKAAAYAAEAKAGKYLVFGGTSSVPEAVIKAIMGE